MPAQQSTRPQPPPPPPPQSGVSFTTSKRRVDMGDVAAYGCAGFALIGAILVGTALVSVIVAAAVWTVGHLL